MEKLLRAFPTVIHLRYNATTSTSTIGPLRVHVEDTMQRRVSRTLAVLLSALMLVATSAPAFAQTSRGTVSGIVSDSQGAVIPGATITLTNIETGVSRTTTSNDEGLYRFDAVDLGTYSVKINVTGFGELT